MPRARKPRIVRAQPPALRDRCQAIADEEGFTLAECDVHSMASFLIERGWFDEEEAWSEFGFATIASAMGQKGGY
jgi:hypothetical protein